MQLRGKNESIVLKDDDMVRPRAVSTLKPTSTDLKGTLHSKLTLEFLAVNLYGQFDGRCDINLEICFTDDAYRFQRT